MRRSKLALMTLVSVMALSQTAWADNVIVAQNPGSSGTAASSMPAANGGSMNVGPSAMSGGSVDTINGPVVSSVGPTSEKSLSEGGYLIYSGGVVSGTPSYNNGVGPGGSAVQNQTSQSQPVAAGQSVAGPAVQTSGAPSAQGNASAAPTQAAAAAAAPTDATSSSVAAPSINGGAAVLYDATTNEILFDKNGSQSMYPASTTKLMTALLAAERLGLDDTITFTDSAVNHLESGAMTADMRVGDTMTVRDALHAMLLRSACEVANGIAEKTAGSQSAFAELMNQRARELGCTNTHFENASGLNGNHTTTARDMALITKAALNNATVRAVLQTKSYTLPATSSRGRLTCNNSNRLLSGGADYYEGIIGGKTGYTSKAGSCLASGIERGGHQLIAVVFKSNTTQYTDTKALYDYGLKRIGASGTSVSSSSSASSPSASGSKESAGTASGKWEQTSSGWKYRKADGSYCTNEWLDVNGNTYFFGSNSIMCIGWKQFTNGSWYYFNPENGAMVKSKWVTQNQKSYYLQSSGIMAVSTVIDGKYRVNENGVYVEKVG